MSRQDVGGSEALWSEGAGRHSDSFSSKTSNYIKKMSEKLFVEDLIIMPAFCVIFFHTLSRMFTKLRTARLFCKSVRFFIISHEENEFNIIYHL